MKKSLSKIILTSILFLLGTLFPQNVSANTLEKETYVVDGITYEKTEKDGISTVIETKDGKMISTYKYNIETNEILITNKDGVNIGEYNLDDVEYDLGNELMGQPNLISSNNLVSKAAAKTTTLKSRFSPWQYKKTGSSWKLTIVDRATKTKTRTYNEKTSGHLMGFKNAIEDIRSGEMAVVTALGYNMAANALAGLFTGGIGTFIAVVSGGVAAVKSGNQILKAMNRGKAHFYKL